MFTLWELCSPGKLTKAQVAGGVHGTRKSRVHRIPENPVTAHFGMLELAARKTLAAEGSVGVAANANIAAIRIVNTGARNLHFCIEQLPANRDPAASIRHPK